MHNTVIEDGVEWIEGEVDGIKYRISMSHVSALKNKHNIDAINEIEQALKIVSTENTTKETQ